MKKTVLNQKQRDLVNDYYEFSKTVVASSFHFADGKEISTGYSLEDAYQEGAVALCTAALHFNADKGVSFELQNIHWRASTIPRCFPMR